VQYCNQLSDTPNPLKGMGFLLTPQGADMPVVEPLTFRCAPVPKVEQATSKMDDPCPGYYCSPPGDLYVPRFAHEGLARRYVLS
jgi:hypothetical protein